MNDFEHGFLYGIVATILSATLALFDELFWRNSTRPSDAVLSIGNVESVYLAAPVEAWATEVKAVLKQLSFAAQITGGTAGRDENLCAAIAEAQRLLAHWPEKEGA